MRLLLLVLAAGTLLFVAVSLAPTCQLVADSNVPVGAVAVLMYHHVDDGVQSANIVSPSTLESHIEAILRSGLEIISLAQLSQWLDQPDPSTSAVVLAFDDGYESFYHHVFQLLQRYQIPASCFLIVSSSEIASRSTSTDPSMYPHLTFDQLREMSNTGVVELGSHSYDGHKYVQTQRGSRPYLVEPLVGEAHADFIQRVSEDLAKSKQVIERVTGTECRYFSYPYGWTTDVLKDVVRQCGFDLAFTTRHGAIAASADRYSLPRIAVRPEMTGADLIEMVASAMLEALGEAPMHGDD